jgi:beta-lactamase superfamily II metal-dependent hydrolase
MAKIHFLNVGHGDCTVIKHNDGKLTMIDINNGDELDDDSTDAVLEARSSDKMDYLRKWTSWKIVGKSRAEVLAEADYTIELTNPIEFLQQNYPGESIFRYIQTHPDFDHMRGLAALESSGIPVLNFWDIEHSREWDDEKDKESDLEDWQAYQRLRNGSSPKVLRNLRGESGSFWNLGKDGVGGGNGIQILSPTKELIAAHDEDGKRNELSYVLMYRTGGRKIILGGDAEQNAWQSILDHYKTTLKCDVLKASHHGRDSGYHQEAVATMNPTVTIVSVGKKPETDASNKYRQYSKRVWSTRWWGNLTLEIGGDGTMNWTASEVRYASET